MMQIYLRAEDSNGNLQKLPTKLSFTTLPDTTPPSVTNTSGPMRISPTGFDMRISQDEVGAFYYILMEYQQLNSEEVGQQNIAYPFSIHRK